MSSIRDVRLISIPKITDRRGNLSFIEGGSHIPFQIRASYWIYNVPAGEKRGGRAYRRLEEFFVALSGSFDVVVTDGKETRVFTLDQSDVGLYVPNMIWAHLENFSTNSVCLILASLPYSPEDYIDYSDFIEEVRQVENDDPRL